MFPINTSVGSSRRTSLIQPVARSSTRSENGRYGRSSEHETLSEQFLSFVDEDSFPCVGAKAALARGEMFVHEFGMLNDAAHDAELLDRLQAFVKTMDLADKDPFKVHSFVAVFKGPFITSELQFENLLWTQLYNLHILDVSRGFPAASDISSNPESPQFSLSLAGHPFFVIGLHPGASRLARTFRSPVLVFNSHRQFEALRADGRYSKMQKAIRKRDIALQGSINPNLADFGSNSEAPQYSGRKVDANWKCPFDFEKARRS